MCHGYGRNIVSRKAPKLLGKQEMLYRKVLRCRSWMSPKNKVKELGGGGYKRQRGDLRLKLKGYTVDTQITTIIGSIRLVVIQNGRYLKEFSPFKLMGISLIRSCPRPSLVKRHYVYLNG